MRTYETLNVEVVKFEAQDVITASVAACTCADTVYERPDTQHVQDGRHVVTQKLDVDGQHHVYTYCPATEHYGCPEDMEIM